MKELVSPYVAALILLGNMLAIGLAASPTESVIPITCVDGRPIVRGTLKSQLGSIPVNFVLELGTAHALVLHGDIAEMMAFGHGQKATVTIGDLQLPPLDFASGSLSTMEELSKNFATELGNISAVGYLGLSALKYQVVELDMPAGLLRLSQASDTNSASGESSDIPTSSFRSAYGTEIFLDYTQHGDAFWLSGTGPDGALNMQLATSHPYTLIDRTVATRLGFPAGNLPKLALRRLNLVDHVALRPEDLGGNDPNGIAAVLGADLLSTFRLIMEPPRKQMRLLQVRPTQSPAAERDFYLIREQADADALKTWLAKNEKNRLASEAAYLLLNWRMQSDAPTLEQVQDALNYVSSTLPVDRRAAELLRIADEVGGQNNENAPAWAAAALKLAEQYAENDANGRAMHDIQARRGYLALKRGDLVEARRQLLSAMFGVPRDPMVNLWMGELYEQMGKPVRAWSRYVQALLEDGGLADAKRGLDRLQHLPAFTKQFRSDDAVELLGGRVPAYHPAKRPPVDPTLKSRSSGHLIEFFTNSDEAAVTGAELAMQGLAEAADNEPVYVIQYHVSTAENADPLAMTFGEYRAARYVVDEPPAAVFDGKSSVEANAADPAEVFEEYNFTLDLVDWDRSTPRPAGAATLDDEQLTVTLQPQIPADMEDVRLFALICTPAVMLPGGNGLFLHHAVARYSLTSIDGAEVTSGKPVTLEANQTGVQIELGTQVEQLEASKGITFYMRPTNIQFDDCYIIAFLQNEVTDAVLAATRIDIAPQAVASATGSQP